ncbi:hypothetical protein C2G38_2066781 [Gigaspora rosea]|uniref:Protein kinase domain-containing protein n=1 Tax=Gigaspora rosea TaxID=44941 RepID=A0A397VT47_9GLOM|nr:hypothetical protein C2G38_2066781 [Gigaspora rosea]
MYLNDSKGKNLINPITIYPLQKPFVLITYVNTTNSFDPKSYDECGTVIDWDGNIKSEMCFDSGSWNDSTIQLNANKKRGFIRFSRNKAYEENGNSWNSWLWQQYSVDKQGNMTNSTNLINLPNISYEDSNMDYSLITIVPTVEDGYLAIFNYTNPHFSIAPRIGLCAIPISYNNPKFSQKIIIFQAEQPINSISCDQTDSFIYCIVSIHFINETFNGMIYEQIQVYPSGNAFTNQGIYSDQHSLSLRTKTTSFCDLIFDATEYNNTDENVYYNIYYYNNASESRLEQLNSFIITNYFSVNAVTQNNTFLLASPNTIDNISWSLLTISLPNSNDYIYDNVFINKTIPSINDTVSSSTTLLNITFNIPVALSAPTSYITIYKASDKRIRQRISTTMHNYLNISSDGLSICINVTKGTFNEYGEQYIVTMDNNFVKGADWNEPLRGIHDGLLILKTDMPKERKPDKAIMGLVRLTQEASKKFPASQSNQSAYIESLLDDIAIKVPINRSRLNPINKPQKLFQDQIVIPISIDAATHENERNASESGSDLAYMIMFKNITTISFGVTNDLDESYNFRLIGFIENKWSDYKTPITIGIMLFVFSWLLSNILSYKLKSKYFEGINTAIYILGLIIPNFIFSILFVSKYSDDVPELYWLSVLVLCFSLFINFCIIVITIDKGFKDPDIGEQFKELFKEYRNLIVIFIILIITDFEYLKFLKDMPKYKCFKVNKIFDQPERINKLEYLFQVAIIFGAFFDITFRNIPQIIIQIKYYKSDFVWVYNWVPLLLLITSVLKIFMIIGCFVCKRISLYLDKCNFYGKCKKCNRPNISPMWCKLCDPQETIKGWTSGNQDLDKYIKGLQIKVMEYEKMIEWIPFEKLTNLQEIREDESGSLFMATWSDGRRILKGEFIEFTRSRTEPCGVNIKILHGIKTRDLLIKEQKGSVVYGITQSTITNRYAIVTPDKFNSRRNRLNGVCKYCNYCNTSPAWCQSCDPWKAALEWTIENKVINNNHIKEFIKEYQFGVTEYEKVIEWIPFDELIDLKEIKGIANLAFMATWVKGVRTVKGESGKFTQSRTISSVDIITLNNSETNTSEQLKVKCHIPSEEYRIHGITQNIETGQYMLVIDFYSNKRNSVNGICEHCKRYNTSPAWCYLCDPPKIVQEISGDNKIDDCIKEFQLKATTFENVIEWIPFNRLENIKLIGKGGFGTVYSSIWLDGKRMVEGDDSLGYVRRRKKPFEVALKTLTGSQTSSSKFLNEFKNHMQCRLEGSALEVYGLTQNTESGQYIMVFQYANRGNLYEFLVKNFRDLEWQKKLKHLAEISYDLSRIHKAGLIHGDFHSGNILLNQVINGNINSYISDLGLSRKQDDHDSKGVYGVIPYIAPEVLKGLEQTKETDIYSLGVIMAEISTGIRPYEGREFNTELVLAIFDGLRPGFAKGTPNCYIELAKQCMNSNPQKRPNAEAIYSKINRWKTILEAENLTDEKELDIKKKFIDANSKIKETSTIPISKSQSKYTSTFLSSQSILAFM